MAKIRVLKEKCSRCGLCVNVCPFKCIILDKEAVGIRDDCKLCGVCLSVCEENAIVIKKREKKTNWNAYKGVLVLAEHNKGVISPVVYELLGKGRELAEKLRERLECVILGNNMEEQAKELISYSVDTIYLYESPLLEEFRDDPYTQLLVGLVQEIKPNIFLLGSTSLGRSIAPRIATRLKTGLTADCTSLDIDAKGRLLQTRPAFGGNILATILCPNTRPQMATVRYKVMKKAEKNPTYQGEIIYKYFNEEDLPDRTRIRKTLDGEKSNGSITEAEIIVSGGKGLGKQEGFKLIKELANVLGGAVGASRAVVDGGWIGYPHQVGLSGRTVRPKLYIACGISGSIQHLAGMQTSETIIAINKDPSAPIFKIADYGIIGDLYKVVPEIIRLVKEIKREDEL